LNLYLLIIIIIIIIIIIVIIIIIIIIIIIVIIIIILYFYADHKMEELVLPANNDELLLEVFGLDKVTDEVTEELFQMLVSRINGMTVSIVATLLTRNPLFRLVPSDIEIVKPLNSLPNKSVVFPLPVEIDDPYLFILLFKDNVKNLLTSMYLAAQALGSDETGSIWPVMPLPISASQVIATSILM
jgi:hypothetical protein